MTETPKGTWTPGPITVIGPELDGKLCAYQNGAERSLRLEKDDGRTLALSCVPPTPEREAVFLADAQRLALCWNAHDALVEALEWIETIAAANYEQDDKLRQQGARTLKRIVDKARAALAAGRGT